MNQFLPMAALLLLPIVLVACISDKPDLTGSLHSRMYAEELARILPDEPLTGPLGEAVWQCGKEVGEEIGGRKVSSVGTSITVRGEELHITEYFIDDEVIAVAGQGSLPLNPIADLSVSEVRTVEYGLGDGKALVSIRRPSQIRTFFRILRKDSYRYRDFKKTVWRRVGGASLTASSSSSTTLSHGCSLGFYLYLTDGKTVCLSGHAKTGYFTRPGARDSFRNEALLPFLKSLSGYKHIP